MSVAEQGIEASTTRVFLLSPASSTGKRCQQLLGDRARFELAERVRAGNASLGEIMSFLSALYFRGKLTYATEFARPPAGCPGVLVITPNRGLLEPQTRIRLADMHGFSRVPIDANNPSYFRPLLRDALALKHKLSTTTSVVLLGSIASKKYVEILLATFEQALEFPCDFVGRGDMSRGGLLLRAARAKTELEYRAVAGSVRRGPRVPKLPKLPRRTTTPLG